MSLSSLSSEDSLTCDAVTVQYQNTEYKNQYTPHQLHHNIPLSQLASLFPFQSCLSLDSDSPSLERGKKNQDKANAIWSLVPIISMH